ncbi:hypothetical protein BJH93_04005 [Kocuria polaris]|nr:hypothetical protein [Kocuria polaris]
MSSTDIAAWAAVAFSGIAAAGWIADRVRDKRNAPQANVRAKVIGTATIDNETFDLVNLTNTGNETAYISEGLYFRNSELHQRKEFTAPSVLKDDREHHLLITSDKPQDAYVLICRRHPKGRWNEFTWWPLYDDSPLHDDRARQFEMLRTLRWRWQRRIFARIMLVGPGDNGLPIRRVQSGKRHTLQRLEVALGEVEPPKRPRLHQLLLPKTHR